jgi:hypothetical protein
MAYSLASACQGTSGRQIRAWSVPHLSRNSQKVWSQTGIIFFLLVTRTPFVALPSDPKGREP